MATTKTAEYELVLMLDPETPEERRDQIAAETRGRIEGGATLKGERAWGMRKLAYEIRQRTEADYRYFRFEGPSPLLDELNHNLKITDGVLRFRIFEVRPETPMIEPPPPVPLASIASRSGGARRARTADRGEAPRSRGGGDPGGSETVPVATATAGEPVASPAASAEAGVDSEAGSPAGGNEGAEPGDAAQQAGSDEA